MITITLPINTSNESVSTLYKEFDRLVKYDPLYSGLQFEFQKAHQSLIKIDGCNIDRSLLSHIESIIGRYLSRKEFLV